MSDKRAVLLLLVASALVLALRLGLGDLRPSEFEACAPGESLATGAVAAADSSALPAGTPVVIAGAVQRGDILVAAFRRSGLSASLSDRILASLTTIFDPKKARPGDVFRAVLDTEMSLLGFQYDRATGESYRVEPLGADLAAFILPGRLVRHLVKREGSVCRSLYEAVRESGGSAEEVDQFASIFSGAFDFFTETREGDTFSYLVEAFYEGGHLKKIGRLLVAEYVSTAKDAAGGGKRLAGIFYAPEGARKGGYYAPDGTSLARAFLRAPLAYSRITSRFSRGRFHPVLRETRPHLGVDFGAALGTPVAAVADGIVSLAAWHGGLGKCVRVKHAGGVETEYGHLSRFAPGIHRGRRVSQGEVIGFVGATGLATGPHLHFNVERNGVPVDPLSFESPGGPPLPTAEIAAFERARDGLLGLVAALPAGVPTLEAAVTTALARSEGPPGS